MNKKEIIKDFKDIKMSVMQLMDRIDFMQDMLTNAVNENENSQNEKEVIFHYRLYDSEGGVSNMGGVTTILKKNNDGNVWLGVSVCSTEDNFNKRVGIELAREYLKPTGMSFIPTKAMLLSRVLKTVVGSRTVGSYFKDEKFTI